MTTALIIIAAIIVVVLVSLAVIGFMFIKGVIGYAFRR